MAKSKISFIPVDNGNMTLLQLNDPDKTTILVDINIRQNADDEKQKDYYDAATYLREHLRNDDKGRPIVDVLLITHLDNDHICGLQRHFHLGKPEDWKKPEGDDPKKIIIGEMWASTRYQKNHSVSNKLSEDAKAFKSEMKRRAELNREDVDHGSGNRVKILGEDHQEDACEGLEHIVYRCGEIITNFNMKNIHSKCTVTVLGPLEQQAEEDDTAFDERNRGSVIIRIDVIENNQASKILLTADAEVDVCKYTWNSYPSSELEYDIMNAPHHCSWHSISFDKENKETVDQDALNALSQALSGAYIISQSRAFESETPPHKEARKEFEKIVGTKKFLCSAEEPSSSDVKPIEFELYGSSGVMRKSSIASVAVSTSSMASVTKEPLGHGE